MRQLTLLRLLLLFALLLLLLLVLLLLLLLLLRPPLVFPRRPLLLPTTISHGQSIDSPSGYGRERRVSVPCGPGGLDGYW